MLVIDVLVQLGGGWMSIQYIRQLGIGRLRTQFVLQARRHRAVLFGIDRHCALFQAFQQVVASESSLGDGAPAFPPPFSAN